MRQLLPAYAHDVDLTSAYAYPAEGAWVRANMVASVDGAAVKDGSSRPLSGQADQHVFGALRGLCDVVLVGAGTARTERYRPPRARTTFLELRAGLGQRPAPALALVSRRLELDVASPLFAGDERTIVITCEAADVEQRRRLSEVADVVVAGDASVDVTGALDELSARGLNRFLCEGGPSLLGAVSVAGRLDELCLTVSPEIVGGDGLRILDGPLVDEGRLTLAHLLEHDGVLFTRYVLA